MKTLAPAAMLAMALQIASCGKPEPDPQPPGNETLKFHMHTTVGTTPLTYGINFTNEAGITFMVEHFQYYVSNIAVTKADGGSLSMGDKVLLVDPATAEYTLGEVPVGSYKGFSFHMGLDSITNHGDPSLYDVGHPLAYHTPSMHWSWSTGYLFLKAEGLVDTSGGTSPNIPFEYHIAVDDLYSKVNFNTSAFQVADGSDGVITLNFDMLKMLNGVDMKTERFTHTFDNMPLAQKIVANYQNAFTVE